MNRWRVLVDGSVGALGIVRVLLEPPLEQRDLAPIPKLIYGCRCVLMFCKDRVKFMHHGQLPFARTTVNDELDSPFLIPQNIDQSGRLNVRSGVRDEILQKALCNQSLGGAPVKIVEALQNACLDAESSHQPLCKSAEASFA